MNEEFNAGASPLERAIENPEVDMEDAEWKTIEGLEEAIKATLNNAEQKNNPDFRVHLESLQSRLIDSINKSIKITNAKISEMESRGEDASSLKGHLNNLYGKLSDNEIGLDQNKAA